jgi:NADH:ubiquinone oxidoreductase subunit E
VDCILQEQRRLKEEEKQAELLLREYQQKASEALARLSRIQQQKEFLVEAGCQHGGAGSIDLGQIGIG